MYEDHFGLTGRPFQLTPDARFWYETATHRKAMAYLGYGLAQGEGFIVVTGDVGTGKTTLVGHLTEQLDRQALNVVTVVSTAIEASDLLRIVATGLGIDPAGLTKAQLLTAIERGLHAVARTGRRTLLIVDEVQALPVESVEELRMLSNFQAGGHALLQILLLGQPEFRERLQGSSRLEQLRQRVIAIHHLDPMEPHEVADYIAHRLSLVGWQGQPDFSEDAFDALYRGSGGVPRRLNLLTGRVMLQASIEDRALIDARLVRSVLRDLSADLPTAPVIAAPTVETPAAPVTAAPVVETPATPVTAAPVVETPAAPVAAAPMVEAPVAPVTAAPTVEPASAPTVEPAAAPVTAVEAAPSAPILDGRVSRFVPRTTRWLEFTPTQDEAPVDDVAAAPEPAPAPEPVAAVHDDIRDDAGPEAATPVTDGALERRVATLEARIEEQERALRRVLTLLVDWVEADRDALSAVAVRAAADASNEPAAMPIRSPTAWDDAA